MRPKTSRPNFSRAFIWLTALVPSSVTHAATGVVTFSGTVTTTCTLNVNSTQGVLTPDATLRTLSSRNSGGRPATVDVITTGGVNISIVSASSTSVPPGDSGNITWLPTYLISGTQPVPETTTPTLLVGSGSRTLEVHLQGTKSSTDTLVNGTYAATVTVKCE